MALYLKYRPRDFDSLVWQDFIRDTLRQSCKEDKLVWAYLLCGPRWTGKTSTARILAKAVNCLDKKEWNPCNKCNICKWINEESLVDVIEIDAASNTWVDNIREIINKAQFRPTIAKYKIYIIDEVHMLSKWAFNALLKILEEPPEFVKFILATTETHKVPETIISRCQRYDFKNIDAKDLTSRLEYIASEENIKIDEKSLGYIVKNSWGWARNAISLFEQLIIKNEIKYETIVNNLWISSNKELEIFLNKLLEENNTIIDNFEELISNWKNIKLFFKDLIFYIKEKTIDLLRSEKEIGNHISILEELDNTYSKTKNSLDENTTFLIWILKIINPIQTLIKPIKEEKNTESVSKIVINNGEYKRKQIDNKEEIKIDDISNIFPEESDKKIEIKKENIKEKSSIFDKKLLIKTLKEIWVKWWLTMWLLWSDTFNNWEILEISFKTPFALKQANTLDNIAFIKKALEKMGMWKLEIKLK